MCPAVSTTIRAERSIVSSLPWARWAMASPMLLMAVTDWPSSSCSSRAMARRSSSIRVCNCCVSSRWATRRASACAAARLAAMLSSTACAMRLKALLMRPASNPGRGGSRVWKSPLSMRASPSTTRSRGEMARPSSQKTSTLPRTNRIPPTSTISTSSSQPSRAARDASGSITSFAPPASAISLRSICGSTSAENQAGASRPNLYADGGVRNISRPVSSYSAMSLARTRPRRAMKSARAGSPAPL